MDFYPALKNFRRFPVNPPERLSQKREGSRILSLIIPLLFFLPALSAQPLLYLGFKAGPAVPALQPADGAAVISDAASGRSLGLFLRYGKRPYYQLGVNWVRARQDLRITLDDRQVLDQMVPVRQFGLSAAFGYHLLDAPRFKWRASTGPYLGQTSLVEDPATGNPTFRDGRWSWQIGTGIDLFYFNLDFGYNLGLGRLNTSGLFPGEVRDMRLNMMFLEFGIHL